MKYKKLTFIIVVTIALACLLTICFAESFSIILEWAYPYFVLAKNNVHIFVKSGPKNPNEINYRSGLLSTISAVDGIILAFLVAVSTKLDKLYDFYRNSPVIKEVIDADLLIKRLPLFIVAHLFFTLFLFFIGGRWEGLLLMLLVISFITLLPLVVAVFCFQKRIEKYYLFEDLEEEGSYLIKNNPLLRRLTKVLYQDRESFNKFTLILQDIILGITLSDHKGEREVQHLSHLSNIYIKIEKNLHLESYKSVFVEKEANGFLIYHHRVILNQRIPYLYRQNFKARNEKFLSDLIGATRHILFESYNKDEDLSFGNVSNFSGVLKIIQFITKQNILFLPNGDLREIRKAMFDGLYWFSEGFSKNEYNSNQREELAEALVDICYFAIDNDKEEFIKELIYRTYHWFDFFREKEKKEIIQTIFVSNLSYALFKRNYNIIALLLQKDKITKSSKYTIGPVPLNIADLYNIFIKTRPNSRLLKFPRDENVRDREYFKQIFVFLVIRSAWEDANHKDGEYHSKNLKKEQIKGLIDNSSNRDKFYNILTDAKVSETEFQAKIINNQDLIGCLFEKGNEVDVPKNLGKDVYDFIAYVKDEIGNTCKALRDDPINKKEIIEYLSSKHVVSGGFLEKMQHLGLDIKEVTQKVISKPFVNVIGKEYFIMAQDGYYNLDLLYNHFNDKIGKVILRKAQTEINLEEMKHIFSKQQDGLILFVSNHYFDKSQLLKDLDMTNESENKMRIGYDPFTINNIRGVHVNLGDKKTIILSDRNAYFEYRKKRGDIFKVTEDLVAQEISIVVNEDLNLKFGKGSKLFKVLLAESV